MTQTQVEQNGAGPSISEGIRRKRKTNFERVANLVSGRREVWGILDGDAPPLSCWLADDGYLMLSFMDGDAEGVFSPEEINAGTIEGNCLCVKPDPERKQPEHTIEFFRLRRQ